MGKVISQYPAAIDNEETKGGEETTSDTVEKLAGKTRWLYESITGESTVSGESPSIPKNPQGTYGIDHSGAPYGPAINHTMAGGMPWYLSSSTYYDRKNGVFTDMNTYCTTLNSTYFDFRIWNRPHADGYGPYSCGMLDFWIFTGASVAGFAVQAQNLSTGELTDPYFFTSTSTLTKHTDTLLIPLVSGFNDIRIEFLNPSPSRVGYISGVAIIQRHQLLSQTI